MAMTISRVDVWAARIKDRPGELSKKLAVLAEAGAKLEFLISRRAPDKPGTGMVFLTPLKGAALIRAAKKVGFKRTKILHSIRIEGPDKQGLCADLSRALAEADINLRGLSAAAIGRRAVVHLALDSAADATKAARILKRLS